MSRVLSHTNFYSSTQVFCDRQVCMEVVEDLPRLRVWDENDNVIAEIVVTPEAALKLAVQCVAAAGANRWHEAASKLRSELDPWVRSRDLVAGREAPEVIP